VKRSVSKYRDDREALIGWVVLVTLCIYSGLLNWKGGNSGCYGGGAEVIMTNCRAIASDMGYLLPTTATSDALDPINSEQSIMSMLLMSKSTQELARSLAARCSLLGQSRIQGRPKHRLIQTDH
jgi:hypothetical protein